MSDKHTDNKTPLTDPPADNPENTNSTEPPNKRGGGPRTEEGRRRSAMNACRHRITSRIHIATPEEAKAYDAHLNSWLEAFKPVGFRERELVVELASLKYRIKRAASLEDSLFAIGHEKYAASLAEHPQAGAALAEGITWIEQSKNLQLLTLYESRLRKAAEKVTVELERLQAARREAYEHAQRQAIQLAKVAAHEGRDYEPGADFQPASAHGEFIFSAPEMARVVDRHNRLLHSYSLPDLELKAA